MQNFLSLEDSQKIFAIEFFFVIDDKKILKQYHFYLLHKNNDFRSLRMKNHEKMCVTENSEKLLTQKSTRNIVMLLQICRQRGLL